MCDPKAPPKVFDTQARPMVCDTQVHTHRHGLRRNHAEGVSYQSPGSRSAPWVISIYARKPRRGFTTWGRDAIDRRSALMAGRSPSIGRSWRRGAVGFGGAGDCKTSSRFAMISRVYPGCAARPWAVMFNAFGVGTDGSTSASVSKSGLTPASVPQSPGLGLTPGWHWLASVLPGYQLALSPTS